MRGLGGFSLARKLTRDRLRVLCYHGASTNDEHLYEPFLFIQPEVFERRMRILQRLGLPVVSLESATQMLNTGSVQNGEVAITFDDGWKSTLTHLAPTLKSFGFPASLFVTTYYCVRQQDVFNVVVWYMTTMTQRTQVHLEGVHPEIDGYYDLMQGRHDTAIRWIRFAETNFAPAERHGVLEKFAGALGMDLEAVLRDDRFKFMSAEEIARIEKDYDIDVQLHTHRHSLPATSAQDCVDEVEENRKLLDEWTGKRCTQFCYPSGAYEPQHLEWLEGMGIQSAVTCDEGLNEPRGNPLLIKRYLDRNTWTDIEFEAAVSGVFDLAARTRGTWHLRAMDTAHLTLISSCAVGA